MAFATTVRAQRRTGNREGVAILLASCERDIMDGEDFEFVVKNASDNGLQALLTYDGQAEPFAFFFGHRKSGDRYSGSLVYLDPVDQIDEVPWEPTVLNIADILQSNMSVVLDDVEVFSRFDPTNVGQPEMRQNRVSRDSMEYESYALQINAIAEEDLQDGEAPEEDYWPVAKLECLMDSKPSVVAILMQDPTLCTDENIQHFVQWLWRTLGWTSEVEVSVCIPAQSLGLLQINDTQ